jgi:tetratricopeptide (TPR) repeat protein
MRGKTRGNASAAYVFSDHAPVQTLSTEEVGIMGARRAAAPVLSGSLPPLADFFYPRPETGLGLADALRPGETTVLVPAPGVETAGGAGAPGGTGKTQLAVGFAHAMWRTRAADVLVWVPAGNRTAILASFAQAAAELDAQQPGETADAAARRFLGWLSRTRQRWVVVLDGVMSPEDLEGLWPGGETGQVVVTTRLPEAEVRGPGRTVVGVPGFSMREAIAYLDSRLTSMSDQRIEAPDLASDLGGLPIAMAQAAAMIAERDTTCRRYRAEYSERLRGIGGAVIEGCPPSVLATWSLAVERAHELPPAGLAWPALAFAAMLDTEGIPAAVLVSPAACDFITGRPSVASASDQSLVRAAFGNLERLGLVSVDKTNAARTVRLHPAVRAAVRAYLPSASMEQAAAAAAAALLHAWPEPGAAAAGAPGTGPQLSQALRDCTASLWAYAGDLLWKPEAHPLLLRAGASLDEDLLAEPGIGYWQAIAGTSGQLLGPGHPQSMLARERLAAAYSLAGRLAEAMSAFEAVLADREQTLGPDHPDTVAARVNMAQSYQAAGREAEALALYELALPAYERLFGTAHRKTLGLRAELAAAYDAAGRRGDSIRLHEQALQDAERALGPAHRDTLTARAQLAAVYQAAGQLPEAIAAWQRTLADQERASGPDHPDTFTTRSSLANAYRQAGKLKEAIAAYQRVLADRERAQGPDHPDTITARGNLAFAYRSAGKLKEAISHYERTLADRERVQGPDHRDTLTTRSNLAAAYQLARRLRDAIPQYERAVADSERMLGAGDIETLTTRCNLATAYYSAGRLSDTVSVLRRALADCEQYLGPDHPMTGTVRENLEAAAE